MREEGVEVEGCERREGGKDCCGQRVSSETRRKKKAERTRRLSSFGQRLQRAEQLSRRSLRLIIAPTRASLCSSSIVRLAGDSSAKIVDVEESELDGLEEGGTKRRVGREES